MNCGAKMCPVFQELKMKKPVLLFICYLSGHICQAEAIEKPTSGTNHKSVPWAINCRQDLKTRPSTTIM
jgi:hypothetical protein